MIAMNDYLVEKLSGLYCIRHRRNPNVFINDEGFISVAACCDEFHETLYNAQDLFRSNYHQNEEHNTGENQA